MSTRLRSSQKPPLPKSPIRSRIPCVSQMQTPPASFRSTRTDYDDLELRPEYLSISCELRALAKRVRDELGEDGREGLLQVSANTSPVFERGRFYDEYSARRNERLKRKKGQKGEEGGNSKTAYNLGVTKAKKIGSLRKSMTSEPPPRYLLRSMSKDNNNNNKKPPLPDKSSVTTRRVKKILY